MAMRAQRGLILSVATLLVGAGACLYLLWWMDNWLTAALAAIATVCLTLPLYVWHETRFVQALEQETQDRLISHNYAGQIRLQDLRRRDREWLELEREKDFGLIRRLSDERDDLEVENTALRMRPPLIRDTKTGRLMRDAAVVRVSPTIEMPGP